ncbi:MAG: hypothetical protein NVS2B15_23100 [Pseudarthrobacter sp.]
MGSPVYLGFDVGTFTDVTGLKQTIPTTTIGASYGAAHLAARLEGAPDIDAWTHPGTRPHSRPES